jgi:predicted nucleic acid-binding protein
LLSQKIKTSEPYINAQMINEFCVNALRKGKPAKEVQAIVERFSEKFNVLPLSIRTIQDGWRIFNEYHFSYWDSLIVAAALEAHCAIFYTEDLTNGQLIDSFLKIINPFVN